MSRLLPLWREAQRGQRRILAAAARLGLVQRLPDRAGRRQRGGLRAGRRCRVFEIAGELRTVGQVQPALRGDLVENRSAVSTAVCPCFSAVRRVVVRTQPIAVSTLSGIEL